MIFFCWLNCPEVTWNFGALRWWTQLFLRSSGGRFSEPGGKWGEWGEGHSSPVGTRDRKIHFYVRWKLNERLMACCWRGGRCGVLSQLLIRWKFEEPSFERWQAVKCVLIGRVLREWRVVANFSWEKLSLLMIKLSECLWHVVKLIFLLFR